jgi:hypothetical protein
MMKLQEIVENVFYFLWNSFHAKFQEKENVGGLWPHSLATCKFSGMQQTHTVGSTSAVADFDAKLGVRCKLRQLFYFIFLIKDEITHA